MAQQIETATAAGTITTAGNGSAIVTSAYMSNSPKTVLFACSSDDTANAIALSARTALAIDADVAVSFLVSGATDKIILTDHIARANDTTLNIALADATCVGITASPASANTQAGSGITNAYATLAEFKSYLTVRGGASSTDAADDMEMEIILNRASRYIDGAARRRFYKNTVDETRYYRAEDGNLLFVDDVVSLTSFHVDSTLDQSFATSLSSTEYDLYPYNAAVDSLPYTWIQPAVNSTESFSTHNKGCKLIGVFGFPSVPDDIKSACLEIALNNYNSRNGQSNQGNISVTAAGVVIRPQDVGDLAKAAINHYKRLL
jgi:hypothetical protein